MKPKVFVPHIFTRWEPASGIYVPTMSTVPASRIGELVIINDKPDDAAPENLLRSLKRILEEIRVMSPGDYIALMGDPILFSCTVAYVMESHCTSEINLLRWNRDKRSYDLLTIPNGE